MGSLASSGASSCQSGESSAASALGCASIPRRVMKTCSRLGDIGPTDEGRTELMPTVMVPFPAPRLQVGGFVVEVAFGKIPVMTKQVSPQPMSTKQRSRHAPQSGTKRGWVCRDIGVPPKRNRERAAKRSICGGHCRVKFHPGEQNSKIDTRSADELRVARIAD